MAQYDDTDREALRARSNEALRRTMASTVTLPDNMIDNGAEIARIADAIRCLRKDERAILLEMRRGVHSIDTLAALAGLNVEDTEALFACALANMFANLDRPRRHWWRRWL